MLEVECIYGMVNPSTMSKPYYVLNFVQPYACISDVWFDGGTFRSFKLELWLNARWVGYFTMNTIKSPYFATRSYHRFSE